MEWLPSNLKVVIPLWQLLALLGGLTLCVLARKSIGMVVVVAPEHVRAALDTLGAHGESAWRIGTVRACSAGEPQAVVEAD